MLHEFLKTNRDELIARCRAKAAKRNHAMPAPNEYGIPTFITQLIETFRNEQSPAALARHKAAGPGKPSLTQVSADIAGIAAKHGSELRLQGLTIDQVVHDYGDLCQALTELAMERNEKISVDEFHTFNRCSDDAIADAVTAFATERAQAGADQHVRILVETALQSFAAINSGMVGAQGATGAAHRNTLQRLHDLVGVAANDSARNSAKPQEDGARAKRAP